MNTRVVEPTQARTPALSGVWRRTRDCWALLFIFAAQLAISFGFINYFCRSFGFNRRLILVHVSVVCGLFIITTFAPGLLLLVPALRFRRLTRFFVAFVPAAALIALLALYLTDFFANNTLGNNINYPVLSQYLFHPKALQSEILVVPLRIYLAIAAVIVFIVGIYQALSGVIIMSLGELILPGREWSLFKNRQRTIKSVAVLTILALGYAGYISVLSHKLHSNGIVRAEPVLSFFTNTNLIYDFNHSALAEKLREEEPRIRASYPRGLPFQKKNVIVIISDSLRADHMSIYGYQRPTTPFLKSLLESGRLRKVEMATSTCAESNCGILSTMSSKTLRGLVPQDFKLYNLLHDQGYNTYMILSGNHDWHGLRDSYGKEEFSYYYEGVSSTKYSWNDDQLIFEGLEKVPDFNGTPSFFYFHLMSTHLLGIKHDEYRRYNPSQVKYDWASVLRGDYDRETMINNYDNGVIQADAIIEQLFGALKQKGYLENSVVVILADHGEGLGDHSDQDYGHVTHLFQELINIPMLFYDDPEEKYGNLKFATQIDVAPTIVDRLGLPIPASWQGHSLLKPEIEEFNVHQTRFQDPWYAVLYRTDQNIYKYMFSFKTKSEYLYDLKNDPGEKNNLIHTADQALVQKMRDNLTEELTRY
ncbi:MAG TPA: sulfatase-like hydrolase/transferase [Blastocatellia bacterium]|nr:sulfatase-like hydrolase/transferase [Blastocatellia bacterium]